MTETLCGETVRVSTERWPPPLSPQAVTRGLPGALLQESVAHVSEEGLSDKRQPGMEKC